ncbi:MAG TPA: hypothetical protein VFN38_18155, partial [Gemmatimonadaceae bacterium]|nr:hypothetical protein [Gemmatimonadaceae bacterium]
TLLCATHDIASTRSFDRVLVLDRGRIVEDDTPGALERRQDSQYARLLKSSAAPSDAFTSWTRLRLDGAQIGEAAAVRAVDA